MTRVATALVVAVLGVALLGVAFGLTKEDVQATGLLGQDVGVRAPALVAPAPEPTAQTAAVYDAFMALARDERLARFRESTPETKAFVFRTHAERYLRANRARLPSSKIALIEDHIAYFAPEVWRTPEDPEIRRKGDELYERMLCGLNHREIGEALDALDKQGSFSLVMAIETWWDCVTR